MIRAIQRIIAMALAACLAGCGAVTADEFEWCRKACEPYGGLSSVNHPDGLRCGCASGVGIYPNGNEKK